MEGLTVAEADLMVYIHPSKATKIRHAILRQLSSLLFTYDEVLEGVLLAYEVNIRSKRAKILPGLIPYFGVKLKANLLLFSPKPDMLLAIMLEDIREEFKYKIKHGAGVFASLYHKRHVIKVGSMIRFLVKSLDEEILHISGSLIPSQTGCIHWLSKHGAEDEPETNRSLKRRGERDIKMEVEEQDSKLSNEGDQAANVSRAHKSRKRTAEE